jgi:transposase-like protein
MWGTGAEPLGIGSLAKGGQKYGGNSFPAKGSPKLTDEQREIAELKKKLRDMEIERDIPKKAIAIPARRQAGSPRATGKIEVHKTP